MCKGLAGVAALPATCLKSAKDMKHRLGFLLQKADACEQVFCSKKEKAASSQKISQEEVKKWSQGLDSLITHEGGLAAFKGFLQSEYSEENIEFWMACEDYKKIKSPGKLAAQAQKIYDDFISVHATKEVNLDSCTREETSQNLLEPTTSCFDTAQRKIFILMEKDSYRRFLKSRFYLDLILPTESRCGGSQKKAKAFSLDNSLLIPQCA